ncbi:hypothetical protein K440DRAFT_643214 [Wilcoxina mikolae CBS 423.85]|nr:hypothetical protein K440DRAFT_643214 [Wilcoxina mikolae CBS 423.85]
MHSTTFILAGISLLALSSSAPVFRREEAVAATASAPFKYDFNYPNLFKYPPKPFKYSGNFAYKKPDPEEGKKDAVQRRGTATEKPTSTASKPTSKTKPTSTGKPSCWEASFDYGSCHVKFKYGKDNKGEEGALERRDSANEKPTSILSGGAKPFEYSGNFKYGNTFKYFTYSKPKLDVGDEATA